MDTTGALEIGNPPEARPLATADMDWALAEGWADFKARRGDLLMLPFIYVLVGILASVLAFNAQLFPIIFPLAAGFALVGPIAAAGFYELSRRREAGLASGWSHFLDPLKGRSRAGLLLLSAILVMLFLGWVVAAQGIYVATLGTLALATPEAFLGALFSTPEGLSMIIIGNAVGAVFAVVTLAVAAFSFPMVVDRPVDGFAAMGASLAAFRRNPVVMIGWGVRVALILALGALPLFVGLMVALPVLGYATWHLYTRAFAR
jgi:uncharacterized membrane protein